MSADLLDLDWSTAPDQQQQKQPSQSGSHPGTASYTNTAPSFQDPFAFLASANPPFPSQSIHHEASQWSSFPPQTATQTFQAPAQSWGGIGALGGLGQTSTVQNTTTGGGNDDDDDDDDGWGDFEVAPEVPDPGTTAASAAAPVPAPAPVPFPPSNPKPSAIPSRTRILRASTIDLMSNQLVDVGRSEELQPYQQRPSWDRAAAETAPVPTPSPKQHSKAASRDSNVLFDADDFDAEESDDFGDFEGAPAPTQPALDLMSEDFMTMSVTASPPRVTKKGPPSQLLMKPHAVVASPYPTAPKSPSFRERNPFPGMGLSTAKVAQLKKEEDAKPQSASPVTAWPSIGNQDASPGKRNSFDDSWGAFEDFPDDDKQRASPELSPSSNWNWDAQETPKQPAEMVLANDEPPPVNVPPPAVVLSLFPQLLDLANVSLFKPVSGQSAAVRNRVLSDPITVDFLRGYLLLATVAARVIAGRKQRWHRDRFLAQSMSISAAGAKGMKLGGIDRAQAAKEDREAADVVGVWREHVGRLRSAVAAANAGLAARGSPPLRVPELGDRMAVQAAKVVPTAPKACVVCGLKREERIAKVDFDVEDSFGEWWIEHWGHRACTNFWKEHEVKLRQR